MDNILNYIKKASDKFKFLKWIQIVPQESLAVKKSALYFVEKNINETEAFVIDDVGQKRKLVGGTSGGGPNNNDTYITIISCTLDDLGVETIEEVDHVLVRECVNSLELVKDANEIYVIQVFNPNFDLIADWSDLNITNQDDFKFLLENSGLSSVKINGFSLTADRLRANVSGIGKLTFASLKIRNVNIVNIEGINELNLAGNLLTAFDPIKSLPSSLRTLNLAGNSLITFDPTLDLPSGLKNLYLDINMITEFNSTLPLPSSLEFLSITENSLTDFNPTNALPETLRVLYLSENNLTKLNPMLLIPNSLTDLSVAGNNISDWTLSEDWANSAGNQNTIFNANFNPTTVNGTNFKSILESKGWTVTYN